MKTILCVLDGNYFILKSHKIYEPSAIKGVGRNSEEWRHGRAECLKNRKIEKLNYSSSLKRQSRAEILKNGAGAERGMLSQI